MRGDPASGAQPAAYRAVPPCLPRSVVWSAQAGRRRIRRGDRGRFPLLVCHIGIDGEDLTTVAKLINSRRFALDQVVDAGEREPGYPSAKQ